MGDHSSSDEDISTVEDDCRRRRKSKKKKRKHDKYDRRHRRKHKRKHRDDDDDDFSSSSSVSRYGDESPSDRRRSNRKKRHKKNSSSSSKKRHKKSSTSQRENQETDSLSSDLMERNFALTEALQDLLEEHPAFVEDLPILLVRLAGGTTFDLSQMTNSSASRRIARVFACLEPFGVGKDTSLGAWVYRNSSSGMQQQPDQELFLVKLVRATLDQIGFTMEAMEEFENPTQRKESRARDERKPPPSANEVIANDAEKLEQQTKSLIDRFQNHGSNNLTKELVEICNMILDGDIIAIDGLPDEQLKTALESIFVECGLEKSELEQEDNDDDEEEDAATDKDPTFGFGMPDKNQNDALAKLQSVLQTCSTAATTAVKPRIKGPMPRPASYLESAAAEKESSDDEGPLLIGVKPKRETPSADMIKARAASRSEQLEMAKQGMDPSVASAMEGQTREEWMIVPGKFDFLSALKAGQPIRNRGFESRSRRNAGNYEAKPIDPKIRAEIDAIRQAHEESRGPSLLEQHRVKKEQEANAAAKKKESWKWNRDKDLDSGRRVDTNALNMIYGGAGSELKKKFQGSF